MERCRWLLVALCAWAAQAHAQRVYTCKDDNGGQTVYQSLPCPRDQDTGISRPLVRDPDLTSADHQRVAAERASTREWIRHNAGYGAPPVQGTVIDSSRDPQACEQARMRREMGELFDSAAAMRSADAEIQRSCTQR